MSYIETPTGSCELPTPSVPGSLKSAETTQPRADTFAPIAPSLSAEPDGIIDMPVSALRTDPQFSELFSRSESVVGRIEQDMRVHGFDRGCPIVVTPDRVVLDGHTRLEAARRAGLTTVKVVVVTCQDDNERLEFAVKRQRDRRNLSDADILAAVRTVDRHHDKGGTYVKKSADGPIAQFCAKGHGRSSKVTAELLGISSRRVEQARQILTCGNAALVAKVFAGERSINSACTMLSAREKRKTCTQSQPGQAIKKARALLSEVQTIVAVHRPDMAPAVAALRSDLASKASGKGQQGVRRNERP